MQRILYSTEKKLGEGASPSPFTCNLCGRKAQWKQDGENENVWWLEAPCVHCGSQTFRVPIDFSTWVASQGTGEKMPLGGRKDYPKYVSHKEVRAFKIGGVIFENRPSYLSGHGGATLTPENKQYDSVSVDENFVKKHFGGWGSTDIVGGYYVVYKDGYESYSPAQAFEDGYTRVEEGE